MKSFGEIFRGLMGGKPRAQEAATPDSDALRMASLQGAAGNIDAQATAAPGIATPAATPEAVSAQPVTAAQPTPLK